MPAFANRRPETFSNKKVEKKTPYCDVCYRKGLPKESYESHYPRSKPGPDGVIVCPTILATLCSYCGENGHWANEKYCQALREDNLEREQRDKARRREVAKDARTAAIWEGTSVKKPVETAAFKKVLVQQNGFSGLSMDSDDEEEEEPVKEPVKEPVSTWSSMASKPAVLIPPEVKTIQGWTTITRKDKYVKKPDENPALTIGEEEAMKILNERAVAGYFDRDDENW